MAMHRLLSGASQPATTKLSPEENALAKDAVEQILGSYQTLARDRFDFFSAYEADIMAAASYAKNALQNVPFGGMTPSAGQFGMRAITAETILAPGGGSAPFYWSQAIAKGWATLYDVNLNYSGSGRGQLQNNYALLHFGEFYPGASIHQNEHQIVVGGTTYDVEADTLVQLSDVGYIPFEGVVWIGRNGTGKVDTLHDQAVTASPRLAGVEFFTATVGILQT